MEENNLAAIVERIMVQNGVNMGLDRPNYTSPLSEYVLQTKLPRGWKVLKFTKFVSDTNDPTVKHIARYLTGVGDIANNENLRMICFPSSLIKNAFRWFTTLLVHSINDWTQFERIVECKVKVC